MHVLLLSTMWCLVLSCQVLYLYVYCVCSSSTTVLLQPVGFFTAVVAVRGDPFTREFGASTRLEGRVPPTADALSHRYTPEQAGSSRMVGSRKAHISRIALLALGLELIGGAVPDCAISLTGKVSHAQRLTLTLTLTQLVYFLFFDLSTYSHLCSSHCCTG